MAEESAISWTDATFNPWWGCTKVSPACDHCYAERDSNRYQPGRVLWGVDAERRTFGEKHWNEPLRWARTLPAKLGRRPRVFCASMADVFDKDAPEGEREKLWALIERTTELDWLLLTKRVGNVKRMVPARWLEPGGWPAHAIIGASIVNREELLRDGPKLKELPAPVRFWSYEPALGPLGEIPRELLPEWVIAGGESGPHARPSHPDWYRSLRDDCAAAGVPFHFKQWGEWLPINQQEEAFTNGLYRSNRKAALHEDQGALDESHGRTCTVPYGVVHADGSFHEPLEPMAFLHGTGAMTTFKTGKKAAGRQLDGIEHNGFPK